jgi:hypothetical protein
LSVGLANIIAFGSVASVMGASLGVPEPPPAGFSGGACLFCVAQMKKGKHGPDKIIAERVLSQSSEMADLVHSISRWGWISNLKHILLALNEVTKREPPSGSG